MNDTSNGPVRLDVPADWTLPALGKRLVPADGSVQVDDTTDALTYYDTATGDLAALDVNVSRGAGTAATWTVLIDGSSSEFPPAGRGVPAEVRDMLLGARGGAALRVTGKATVARTVHRVLDGDGVELGTVTEVVTAPDGATADARRHVEVAGWDDFVAAAVRRLQKSDAVARVSRPAVDEPSDTVGSALLAYLRSQRRAVLRADVDLRLGGDSVHAFRVAVRRIRSALRVVSVADPERLAGFDAELRWLSQVLGAVRDLQVLRDHLDQSITAIEAETETADGPGLADAKAAIGADLDTRAAAAGATLTAVLAGRRYLAVLRELRDWCAEPPFESAADEPAKRLARYVRGAAKDLDKRLGKAGGSADKLHSARKAAKRARYVASFAGKSAGPHGRDVVKRAKALQTSLGDHQDCVLAAAFVARTARTASGAAAFGCGVVWSYEQERAAAALRTARKASH